MALVKRNGRTYYYKNERRAGLRTCSYVGAGLFAELAAELDAAERAGRTAAEAEFRGALALWDEADARAAELTAAVDAVMRADGWWRPARKNWRRKRGTMVRKPKGKEGAKAGGTATPPAGPTPEEAEALIAAAREGDHEAMSRLVPLLDNPPEWFRIRPFAAEVLADAAEHAVALAAAGGMDLLTCELIRREIARDAEELAGTNASALEKLLARRVALCSASVAWFERSHALDVISGMEFSKSTHLQERIDRAHRRLLTAAKTLAVVRRAPAARLNFQVENLRLGDPGGLTPTVADRLAPASSF